MRRRLFLAATLLFPAAAFAKDPTATPPDFTRGGFIPQNAKHDWNLGATGLRGWMHCDKLVTSDARQIAITKVEANSPSEGLLAVGDVILGVGGKPFSFDPRTELGNALTAAEAETGEGKLALTRWREGKTEEVVLMLPVTGSYLATATFDCQKFKRNHDEGVRGLATTLPVWGSVPYTQHTPTTKRRSGVLGG